MKNKSKTKYAILGILTIKPMSGYDIKKMIDHSISHFWNESFGQLYPSLKTMENEGLISISSENNGNKQKNIYSITANGIAVLNEWLANSPDTNQIRLEPLLKIFFGYNTDIDITIKNITDMKSNFQNQISVLNIILKNFEQYKKTDNSHIYPLLTVQYGIFNYEANLKWTEYALETLEKLKKGDLK